MANSRDAAAYDAAVEATWRHSPELGRGGRVHLGRERAGLMGRRGALLSAVRPAGDGVGHSAFERSGRSQTSK